MNISLLAVVILIALRKKILSKLNNNNLIGNFIFITLLIIFLTISYMKPISFSIIDDKVAKNLVSKTIKTMSNQEFTQVGKVLYKQYDLNNKNNYFIKAELQHNNKQYYLFIKTTCHFLNGCTISNEKTAIVDKNYIDTYREGGLRGPFDLLITEDELFNKKSCADFYVLDSLKKTINDQLNTITDIDEINFIDIKKSKNKNFKHVSIDKVFHYTQSCQVQIKTNNESSILIGYDIYVNASKNSSVKFKKL